MPLSFKRTPARPDDDDDDLLETPSAVCAPASASAAAADSTWRAIIEERRKRELTAKKVHRQEDELDNDLKKEGLNLAPNDSFVEKLRADEERDALPDNGTMYALLAPSVFSQSELKLCSLDSLRELVESPTSQQLDSLATMMLRGDQRVSRMAASSLIAVARSSMIPALAPYEFLLRTSLVKPTALKDWKLKASLVEAAMLSASELSQASTPSLSFKHQQYDFEAIFRCIYVLAKIDCVEPEVAIKLMQMGLDARCDDSDGLMHCITVLLGNVHTVDSNLLAEALALVNRAKSRLAATLRLCRSCLPPCALKIALIEAVLAPEGLDSPESGRSCFLRCADLLAHELQAGGSTDVLAYHRWYFILSLFDECARTSVILGNDADSETRKKEMRRALDELREAHMRLRKQGHKPFLLLVSVLRIVCEVLERHAQVYKVGETGTFGTAAVEEYHSSEENGSAENVRDQPGQVEEIKPVTDNIRGAGTQGEAQPGPDDSDQVTNVNDTIVEDAHAYTGKAPSTSTTC